MTLIDDLRRRSEERKTHDAHRALVSSVGIDFCSNDYLGLAHDPRVHDAIVERIQSAKKGCFGGAASRLLGGTTDVHDAFEKKFAAFKGVESSLVLSSGYQANLALLAAVVEPNDRVVSDALNHRSLVDAIRLSSSRHRVVVAHRDTDALERVLCVPHREGRTFVVTEAVFSMDGDLAPLGRIAELCAAYGAELVVDEAHAAGLYGGRRSGLVEALGLETKVAATVTTLGKSFGLSGGVIAGSKELIDHITNVSPPFIFSTAVAPLFVLALDGVLDFVMREIERGNRALMLAKRLRHRLRNGGMNVLGDDSAIVPVVFGDPQRTLAIAERLRDREFHVRAIRTPTVPNGTERIRISVHANRGEDEIDALAAAFEDLRAPR